MQDNLIVLPPTNKLEEDKYLIKKYRREVILEVLPERIMPGMALKQLTSLIDADTLEELYQCRHPVNAEEKCKRMKWKIVKRIP